MDTYGELFQFRIGTAGPIKTIHSYGAAVPHPADMEGAAHVTPGTAAQCSRIN